MHIPIKLRKSPTARQKCFHPNILRWPRCALRAFFPWISTRPINRKLQSNDRASSSIERKLAPSKTHTLRTYQQVCAMPSNKLQWISNVLCRLFRIVSMFSFLHPHMWNNWNEFASKICDCLLPVVNYRFFRTKMKWVEACIFNNNILFMLEKLQQFVILNIIYIYFWNFNHIMRLFSAELKNYFRNGVGHLKCFYVLKMGISGFTGGGTYSVYFW